MEDTNPFDKLKYLEDEHKKGNVKYYIDENGQKQAYNVNDLALAKIYKLSKDSENEERKRNHYISVISMTMVVVIVLLIMIFIYLTLMQDITGIYYDKNGNKIEIYHNRFSGTFNFTADGLEKQGIIKKINNRTYGIYLNDDLITGHRETLSSPISAYYDLNKNEIIWKNNSWKLDKYSYAH
jgi:hypothetical protein